MTEKIDLDNAARPLGTVRETVVTEKVPESSEERTARLNREKWEANMSHAFRGVAVLVYVATIVACVYYLTDPKLGEWAERALIPLVTALAAFAVGKSK